MLDENEFLKNHDLYEKKLVKNFKKDIKNTIDIIHGRAFLLRTKRNYSGLYLKDISKYNLGYILGTNTSPEAVTLSNLKHSDKDNYHGEYISLEKGSSFEALVAKMLDYASSYEIKKYRQISLFSYLTTIETDPIEYKYESKMTKDASLNMDLISSGELENLFVAYRYHPNSADFLDYEYENLAEEDRSTTDHYRHLERVNEFYEKPVLISDTGISSSRSISKVDLRDGFNRGGIFRKAAGDKVSCYFRFNR